MYQNYVAEVKKYFNGEYEHEMHWAYDEDADICMLKTEQIYYRILDEATMSNTASHAAIMFTGEGFYIDSKCYHHKAPEET